MIWPQGLFSAGLCKTSLNGLDYRVYLAQEFVLLYEIIFIGLVSGLSITVWDYYSVYFPRGYVMLYEIMIGLISHRPPW